MAELAAWVEAGPDPARSAVDSVVLWRRKDLQHSIEAAFAVTLHERTVGKQLAALGYRRLSVRPQHPKSNQLLTFAWNGWPRCRGTSAHDRVESVPIFRGMRTL